MADADESSTARERSKIPVPCPEWHSGTALGVCCQPPASPGLQEREGDLLEAFCASCPDKQGGNDKQGKTCRFSLLYQSPPCLCSAVTAQAAGRGKEAAGVGMTQPEHSAVLRAPPGTPWHSGGGRRAQQPQPPLQDSPGLLAAAGATAASPQH